MSILALFHDLDLGVFIATNGPGNDKAQQAYTQIFYYVTDLVLGATPWLAADKACDFPQPWVNATADALKPPSGADHRPVVIGDSGWSHPEMYTGSYGNRLVGDVVISEEQGHRLNVVFNKLTGRLHRTSDENVLMMEAEGVRHFLSVAGVNETVYIKCVFFQPPTGGRYLELQMTLPGDTDVWVFKRSVRFSSPVPTDDPIVG